VAFEDALAIIKDADVYCGVACCLAVEPCSWLLFSADLVEKEAAEEALSRYAEVCRLVYGVRHHGSWLHA
jgi:hypothetical protein